MKTLKFDTTLVPLILSGEKTATWRLFDDKNLSVNDELEFIEKQSGQKFGKAIIVGIDEKKLGEISESDFDGHEKFVSHEEIMRTYQKYYGDKVGEDTIVKMIKFRIIK
ncbi:MAG: ASCH domain-containing protein [Patescibacteria group bacterium]|jgi:hypothetical protein